MKVGARASRMVNFFAASPCLLSHFLDDCNLQHAIVWSISYFLYNAIINRNKITSSLRNYVSLNNYWRVEVYNISQCIYIYISLRTRIKQVCLCSHLVQYLLSGVTLHPAITVIDAVHMNHTVVSTACKQVPHIITIKYHRKRLIFLCTLIFIKIRSIFNIATFVRFNVPLILLGLQWFGLPQEWKHYSPFSLLPLLFLSISCSWKVRNKHF